MSDLFENEYPKMVLFGRWLTELASQKDAELYQTCGNIEQPLDKIRLKYGQSETTKFILEAFTEIFQGDIEEFKKSRFAQEETATDE